MAHESPENLTNMAEIFRYADRVSGNIFGIGMLISIFMVVFLYMKFRNEETANCFVVAGFITSITAVLFLLMELINSRDFFVCVLIFSISLAWSLLSKD